MKRQIPNIITLCNEQATYYGIQQAFSKILKDAHQNDVVYIHFSGHGQQITDLNGDEQDGWDECWIPYDAPIKATEKYHGERHVTDDELNYYLCRMRERVGEKGTITIVSDACHSGTGTRKVGEMGIRGTSAKFLLTDYSLNQLRQWGFYKYALSVYAPQTEQWIHISACADNECNRQYNGILRSKEDLSDNTSRPYGSLTYALYLLRDQLSSVSANDLFSLLQQQVKQLVLRPQTPQLEGDKALQENPIL